MPTESTHQVDMRMPVIDSVSWDWTKSGVPEDVLPTVWRAGRQNESWMLPLLVGLH